MTRDALLALVKTFTGRTTGTSKDSLIVSLLNWSQTEIARHHNWRCLSVVETGTFTIDLGAYDWPSTTKLIVDFRITGDYAGKIHRYLVQHADKVDPDPTSESPGTPTHYIDYGSGYVLVPTPDLEYPWALRRVKYPAELTVGSQESDLTGLDDLLVYVTCMHFALGLGLLDDFSVYRTAVYTEYPIGSQSGRGLLKQCVQADRAAPDQLFIRRPFTIDGVTGKPADFLQRPFWQGD